jgi:23S rRNA-/tRNA-specific pseudouridylate synthase
MKTVKITQENIGTRIDTFIMKEFNVPSRSFLKKNWEDIVSVNDKDVKPSYKLRDNDIVEIRDENIEDILKDNQSQVVIIPQKHTLDIVLENNDFLVINKPKGMAVHPGIGNPDGTLANFVVGYLEAKGEYDPKVERGGVVHRLDKSVSGLILFAKTYEAQKHFQKQFEEHKVIKIYDAKVKYLNNMSNEIKQYIPQKTLNVQDEISKLERNSFNIDHSWLKVEGYMRRSSVNRMKMIFEKYPTNTARYALTYIKPVSKDELLINIKTGRMYQIRAVLEYLGLCIRGDSLFETLKGGVIPQAIELEAILLSAQDMSGDIFTVRLK